LHGKNELGGFMGNWNTEKKKAKKARKRSCWGCGPDAKTELVLVNIWGNKVYACCDCIDSGELPMKHHPREE
jgi:hypothetical protein